MGGIEFILGLLNDKTLHELHLPSEFFM